MKRNTGETSREAWVRNTRESTLRALAAERIPMSAQSLEGNLDVGTYISGMGFVGVRSSREIGAALRYLEGEGFARRLTKDERCEYDPPGVIYEVTLAGLERAARTEAA